jgi:hypothetical protein
VEVSSDSFLWRHVALNVAKRRVDMLMVVMSHGPRVKMFISILEQGRNPFMNKWMMPKKKNFNHNIKMFILGLE